MVCNSYEKKSNIQWKLNKYRRSGIQGHGDKSAMEQTMDNMWGFPSGPVLHICCAVQICSFPVDNHGYCSSYVSDTSTSAVSKTCVGSFSKLFGKIHKQHTFFVLDVIVLVQKLWKFDSMHSKRRPIQEQRPCQYKDTIATKLPCYKMEKPFACKSIFS